MGMTLKQAAKARFFDAVSAYRDAKASLQAKEPGAETAFVVASLRLHAAKGGVPKSYWPMARRAERD